MTLRIAPAPPVDRTRTPRRIGLTGSIAAAVGAFGAGALPGPPPPAPLGTVALALTYAGALLLVIAWFGAARVACTDGTTPSSALRMLITWAAPFALAPPLFSRDVYAMLAQGAVAARGLDPGVWSPLAALGPLAPQVRATPELWRDDPSPYGPLAQLLQQAVAELTGTDLVAGVALMRVAALAGLAAIVWALLRLGARRGIDGGRVIVLGAAHPLVLFHLVSGVHLDALVLGAMLVGLELAARDGTGRDGARWAGYALITTAAMVKLPALLALGFVAAQHAARRGGRPRDLVAVGAAALAVVGAVAAGSAALLAGSVGGSGWTWVAALDVPASVVTWLSAPSVLGFGLAHLLGAPLDPTLAVVRGIAVLAGACVVVALLRATVAGRVDAVRGTALGMVVAVACGPAVQPWYLLLALLPLVVSGGVPHRVPRFAAVTAVIALIDAPPGDWWVFAGMQPLVAAPVAAAGVLLLRPLWQRLAEPLDQPRILGSA
ncbi:polyprenol phosphomannose-dependent alpha 1,6 mannosyltransferase MptB [Pseudonocardia thermophila]|uniref:polyprenol phosphomannose-dependent alpha 1,6 mannosyltransferase MptB n=1 Tax=Pseudonocardia thermophila TaxID=1848 RepID=UPI00248E3283|nr:polyprenol phosphomannose-dependent alpha 1,6 mannosyltransferase MptB [Pseudonocardia thermophila]